MNITTTIAWRMGRNGEKRGATMGPFKDGTLADGQWRAGFDALAETVEYDPNGYMDSCPKVDNNYAVAISCSRCPLDTNSCCDPNPPRRT